MHESVTGSYGIAIGYQSQLHANNTNSAWTNTNTSVGYQSLFGSVIAANNTGINNTAFGYQSLLNFTSGDNNTGVGYNALYNVTIGGNNTSLGYNAGGTITTGSNNLALGYNAQVPVATASNQIVLGDSNITYAGVQVAWTITSDQRLKNSIREVPSGLDLITALKPVDYYRNGDASGKREVGFIAQDVQQALHTLGLTDYGMIHSDDAGTLSLRYNDFIPVLARATQELNVKVDTHQMQAASDKMQTDTTLATTSAELSDLKTENLKLKTDTSLLSSAWTIVADTITAIKDTIVQNFTVNGSALFKGRVKYQDKDTAGFAIIKAGATEVEIIFAKPYEAEPIMSVTAYDGHKYVASIKNASRYGFTIAIAAPQAQDLRYSWSAVAVEDATTVESGTTPTPQPTASQSGGQATPSPSPPLGRGEGQGEVTPTTTLTVTPTPFVTLTLSLTATPTVPLQSPTDAAPTVTLTITPTP